MLIAARRNLERTDERPQQLGRELARVDGLGPARSGARRAHRRSRPRARRRRARRSAGSAPRRGTPRPPRPLAPVPEESVSPTPRSKIRARTRDHPRRGRSSRWCGSGRARAARSRDRSPAGPAPRARRRRDRALRVADRDVPERPGAARRLQLAATVLRARGVVRSRWCDALPHRRACTSRSERDRRGDRPRRGHDRELVGVGPAGAAQVHHRLTRPVARTARPRSRRG